MKRFVFTPKVARDASGHFPFFGEKSQDNFQAIIRERESTMSQGKPQKTK
jgi:hypothetical protein